MSKNIHQRVLAVIEEGKVVEKTGQMKGAGSFNFHKTDDVLAHLRPYLVKNGILFSYSVEHHEFIGRDYEKAYNGNAEKKFERQTVKAVECRLINVDEPEDFIVGVEYGYGIDPQDKGPGKATSYAVKTWLLNQFQLRGQPDENTVNTRDGYISEEQQLELRQLMDRAFVDDENFFAYLGVTSLENVLLSKFSIAKRDLVSKVNKSDALRKERSDAQQSLAPKETEPAGEF